MGGERLAGAPSRAPTPANSHHFLMAQQNSFDIVSQVDMAEVNNALDQTMKEVRQRFDFKGSHAEVRLEGRRS